MQQHYTTMMKHFRDVISAMPKALRSENIPQIGFLHRDSAVTALDFTSLRKSLRIKASPRTTKCHSATKQFQMSLKGEIIPICKDILMERFDVWLFGV